MRAKCTRVRTARFHGRMIPNDKGGQGDTVRTIRIVNRRKIRHKVRAISMARGNREMLQRLITISREAKKCVSYRRPSRAVTSILKSFMMGMIDTTLPLEPYIGTGAC